MTRVPKQSRSRAKYEAILDAAIHVLVSEGYAGASTVRIATEAGVSVGSIYAYFTDKDDIFSTYVDTRIGLILAGIAANVEAASYPTAEDGIRDIVQTAVSFTMANRPVLSAMVGRIPGVYDSTMLGRVMGTLYEVAEEFYRAHGLVRTSEEAKRITYVLTGTVTGFFIRLLTDPHPPLTADEVCEELVAMIMGYIVRYQPG